MGDGWAMDGQWGDVEQKFAKLSKAGNVVQSIKEILSLIDGGCHYGKLFVI